MDEKTRRGGVRRGWQAARGNGDHNGDYEGTRECRGRAEVDAAGGEAPFDLLLLEGVN